MLIPHKGHTDTIQVYSVTVMTHVKALQAGHSSQGTSEPITPVIPPFVDGCTDMEVYWSRYGRLTPMEFQLPFKWTTVISKIGH